MHTLCIRCVLDPNRIGAFRTHVEDEVPVIRQAGGGVVGYYFPTDYAGPTNVGYGLIEFATLTDYERHRQDARRRSASSAQRGGTDGERRGSEHRALVHQSSR